MWAVTFKSLVTDFVSNLLMAVQDIFKEATSRESILVGKLQTEPLASILNTRIGGFGP